MPEPDATSPEPTHDAPRSELRDVDAMIANIPATEPAPADQPTLMAEALRGERRPPPQIDPEWREFIVKAVAAKVRDEVMRDIVPQLAAIVHDVVVGFILRGAFGRPGDV